MAASVSAPSSRWLYGPVPDLLLGCGLWYIVAFEIFAVYGVEVRYGGGLVLAPMLALLLGTPHHGATLVRVYERRQDRRAYTFFAVHASILVWAAFAFGVHSPLVGSWILTIFLTWSPWHYTGQNYGISVMFLRRRGVEVTPGAKRWLYATFVLSYVLTFLVMHHSTAGASYALVPHGVTGYRFLSLPIPFAQQLFVAALVAYGAALVVTAGLFLRRASPSDLAPAGLLLASQALWFSIPVAVRAFHFRTGFDVLDTNPEYYFIWIGVAHAVQYLWVTSYYAKASPTWRGQIPYFGKVLLAGAAVWTLPALLFAPGVLGRVPFDAGLAALVAACVNLQHFILDGAIWKLRDGRVARILIRSDREDRAESERPRGPWLRRAVWATSAVCVAVMFVHTWEAYFGVRRAMREGDLERVETAVERIALLGRDNPQVRLRLGRALEQQGADERALRAYERSVEIQPSVQGWRAIAGLHASEHRWSEAIPAYEEALALAPNHAGVLHEAGVAWLEQGETERARQALERAAVLDPDREDTRAMLRRLDRPEEHPG